MSKLHTVWVAMEPQRWDAASGAFVAQYDLTKALRYGDLKVALAPRQSLLTLEPIVVALREKFADFRDEDYLIAIGSPILIAISAHIALQRTGGYLNLLTWDRTEQQYLNTLIDIEP